MTALIEDGGRINEEALEELSKNTDMIECRCPAMLMHLLREVRKFEAYTGECIEKYPEDAATHHWLKGSALNLDQLLSTTLVQLARMEGFIDDENHIVPRENFKDGAE